MSKIADLRSQILDFHDVPEETITIPEWGNIVVVIKGMTGASRANMMTRSVDPSTGEMSFEALYPEVIIATVMNPETGEPVFGPNDRDVINTKSGGVLERLARDGMRLSGLTRDEQVDLGKDSSTENGDSTSDSQNTSI